MFPTVPHISPYCSHNSARALPDTHWSAKANCLTPSEQRNANHLSRPGPNTDFLLMTSSLVMISNLVLVMSWSIRSKSSELEIRVYHNSALNTAINGLSRGQGHHRTDKQQTGISVAIVFSVWGCILRNGSTLLFFVAAVVSVVLA